MNNPTQHRRWFLGRRGGVTGVALALAIMLVPAVVASRLAQAQTYTYSVRYSFTGALDGGYPLAGVVQDAQGNLCGTTNGGGAYGYGTVFKVDTTGKETVFYSFKGTGGDGVHPEAGLVLDAQGNLYGTTYEGGAYGVGTVFKLDTTGNETVLHSFANSPDGASPLAGLVLDVQGNLYGTTSEGGAYGVGTVFKVDTTGNETVVHSFSGSPDGLWPFAGLVLDAQGNLYGTTGAGGNGPYGSGTVFKVDTNGNETVLYNFGAFPDGGGPQAGLVLDAHGYLYGTTYGGGQFNQGAAFWVQSETGEEEVIHDFRGKYGANPQGGLVLDARSGVLYGTTSGGGAHYTGTVFEMDTYGDEVVLHSFGGKAGDGTYPFAGLGLDEHGNLYGTTYEGGAYGAGTVFKLTPATTTTLASSPNPSVLGQGVTFTAAVTPVSFEFGVPPDGETVSFMKGTTVLGTGSLSGGSTSFTTSKLKVGTLLIKAVYGGDSNFGPSTSKAVSQVVNKATTTTTLVSSLNPSNFGQAVTFTASVAPEFSGKVTGDVAFYDGTTFLGGHYVIGGVAKFTTSTLAQGTHTITATYNGNANFIGSSASLTQTVN